MLLPLGSSRGRSLFLLFVTMALIAASCGGSDASSGAAETETTSAPEVTSAPETTAAPAPTTAAPVATTTTAPDDPPPPEAAPSELGSPATTVDANPAPADVPVVASSGCGTSSVAAGSTAETLGDRAYLQFIPDAHDGQTPVPLVLNFHGLTSNAGQQVLLTGMDGKADEEEFVAVHPEGSTIPGTETTFFNTDISGTSEFVDDVAFVDGLLDALEANLCVDTNRIFTTGMSNGGFMTSALSCTLSERFAAAVSVAGIDFPEGDCTPTRQVPLLHVHGTADDVVPFEGGESSLLGDGGTLDGADVEFVPIPDEVDQWAEALGCDPEPDVIAFSDEVTVEDFASCAADLEFWVVDGGGHTWPGTVTALALQDLLGFSTADFNTTDLAWDWFLAHPKG